MDETIEERFKKELAGLLIKYDASIYVNMGSTIAITHPTIFADLSKSKCVQIGTYTDGKVSHLEPI